MCGHPCLFPDHREKSQSFTIKDNVSYGNFSVWPLPDRGISLLTLFSLARLVFVKDFPACLFCYVCVCCVLVTQLCTTLCDPMDCSPPASSVHWFLLKCFMSFCYSSLPSLHCSLLDRYYLVCYWNSLAISLYILLSYFISGYAVNCN